MRFKNRVWINAVLFMAVLVLTGANVSALDTTSWRGVVDPNTSVANWNIPSNWSLGLVPVADQKANFNEGYPEAVIDDAFAISGQTVVGGDGAANSQNMLRVAKGGVWNTTNSGTWTAAGYNRSGHITVERGGTMITAHRVGVGLVATGNTTGAPSTLNVNGGFVDITGNLQIGTAGTPGHVGIVTVNSGLLKATNWEWRDTTGVKSFMDVRHGTVVIGGDRTGAGDVPALLASGALTGFGGDGTINAAFANGVTTITANDPLARTPEMDAIVSAGDIDLSWINLQPNVWAEVYFGTDLDNLGKVVDANDGFNLTTTTVTAPEFNEYIWRVDTYLSAPGTDPNDPIVGDTMYFVASDDSPPSIVMNTSPTATWINEPTMLQVTVYDDGKSDVTVTWSAVDTSGADAGPIADPNVVFDPPFTVIPAQASYTGTGIVVTTTMTVDYHAAQMRATAVAEDSNPLLETASASVNLDCANSACQAATAVLNLDDVYVGDIAVDCKVNLTDFAVMARQWLTDYALTGPVPYPQE